MLDRASTAQGRAAPLDDTFRRLTGVVADFGVTRLADQTSLDVVGVPTFAAIRPNGVMLSVHQGKGLTIRQAQISAMMEAIECAVAEKPPARSYDRDSLPVSAHRFAGQRLLRTPNAASSYVAGLNLVTGLPVHVPSAVVHYASNNHGVTQTTNGLAAGNCDSEAILHGVCELVETDAETRFWLVEPSQWRRFGPESLHDPHVCHLADLVAAADLQLFLFDLTTDIHLPTVLAILSDPSEPRAFGTVFGLGCHVLAHQAASAAILEAAQSRVTNVAGSRDDILPDEFSEIRGALPDWQEIPLADPPKDAVATGTPWRQWAGAAIRAVDCAGADLVAVQMDSGIGGVHVWRVLSDTLEDRSVNPFWRPGRRAFRWVRSS